MGPQQIDVNETILIVVGSELKSEEKDRPLAYWLQQQIDKIDDFEKIPFRKSVVISDALFLSDKIIQVCPTISIGGPGVNSVAAEWAGKLPVYISEDNRYYIQYDDTNNRNRISIWGMDQEMTSGALNLFIESGLLKQYLKKVWKEKAHSN